MKLRLS